MPKKKPTRKQAEIIRKWGLNSGNWHVFKAPVGGAAHRTPAHGAEKGDT